MRAYEKEPVYEHISEPEIIELGIDDNGEKQWYMATREGFEEVGNDDGVLTLDRKHFNVGTRIELVEPF